MGVMDYDSGKSMEPMEKVPRIGLGESELDRLSTVRLTLGRRTAKGKINMIVSLVNRTTV